MLPDNYFHVVESSQQDNWKRRQNISQNLGQKIYFKARNTSKFRKNVTDPKIKCNKS